MLNKWQIQKGNPKEYIWQQFCRIFLDIHKYSKSHIKVEYPIKIGFADKRCRIVVFHDEEKSQSVDNQYKKHEKLGVKNCGVTYLQRPLSLELGLMALP